jgi:hypothetical protein
MILGEGWRYAWLVHIWANCSFVPLYGLEGVDHI